ncbi:MAG TPA: DUF3108 domain-containing protein [Candidatus Methylomirabilis sp.]|nr:DUF3108 domain-containing protein [Candidatus Methylomirabilis sp.]
MSRRVLQGIAAVAILGCVAAGAYWVRTRSERTIRAEARSLDSEPLSPPPAAIPSNAPAGPSATGSEKKVASITDTGLPLRSGEVLEYAANVANLNNVADLQLHVREHRSFLGKNAWHLQAFAHTENPLRMVFALDDQFDSYSDAATMTSLQYEMHLNERGQKVESIQRMTSTGKEPAPPNVTETRVLPETRDPLGLMQYLRNVDWTKTAEVACPVYDGHALYEVKARVVGENQAVSVPAGSYKATKIEIRVFEHGQEMKDAHFTIYFANGASHTPLLLEAVMPVATARVELLHAK